MLVARPYCDRHILAAASCPALCGQTAKFCRVPQHFPSRFNGWLGPEDFELFCVDELLDAEDASI